MSQKFRLKDIDETKNYFLEKIKQNSAFTSFIGLPIRIVSSVIELKIRASTAGIKRYKTIIKKKKKQHDKTVLLSKYKLNSIEILIYKALIDSNISHDQFVLINNVLKGYDEMKEFKIKHLKT